jgi:acetyl-CoA carboxylase carboxyl transferase subunit beta
MGFLGLFSRLGPKIKVQVSKKDGFSGWIKCSGCGETIHANELVDACNCCPKCEYHYRMTLQQRIALLTDSETFQEMFTHIKPSDPLTFVDSEKYIDRLQKAQEKSGRDDAICVGSCLIEGFPAYLAILDFNFMGGSMGSVVGERLTLLIEEALKKNHPLVVVSSSGGARMQESIFSLMQMAKTSGALGKLHEAGIPYISVLTNPTTGGVTASFASLGDIIIAEPGALIGFAGPRIVEQTIRQKLPEGAQRSEFLKEKGMVDCIVSRSHLKKKIAFFINFLMNNNLESVQSLSQKSFEDVDVAARLKRFFAAAVGR